MSKNIQALSSGGSVNVMQPSAAMLEHAVNGPQLLDASAAQYGDKILIDFLMTTGLTYQSWPSSRESWRIAWYGWV